MEHHASQNQNNPQKTIETWLEEAEQLKRQDYLQALQLCQRAEELSRKQIPCFISGIIHANVLYSSIFIDRGRYHEALLFLDEALRYLDEQNDHTCRHRALNLRGLALLYTQQFSDAMAAFTTSLELARRLDDREKEASSLDKIGIFYAMTGDAKETRDHYLQSLEIYRELDDTRAVAILLTNLLAAHGQLGEYEKALEYGHAAMEALKQVPGERFGAISLHINMGQLHQILGADAEALEQLDSALRLAKTLNYRIAIPPVLRMRAELNADDNPGLAAQLLQQALEVATEVDSQKELLDSYQALYEHYKCQGDVSRALTYHEHYVEVLTRYYEEKSKEQYQLLEVMHRTRQARHQAEIYKQRSEILKQQRDRDREYFMTLSKMKDEVLQTASHDLKSPLNSIYLTVDLLKRQSLTPRQLNYTERIIRSADQMRTLIVDLLDLAKIATGRALSKEVTQLVELISQVIQAHHDIAERQEVNIILQAPEPSLKLPVDAERLRQVIDNLLSNAIKYSPPGATVTITVTPRDSDCLIQVIDEGPGIAPEHHARLFERFYRVDSSREKVEGTGLGLAIVKSIVESHDGHTGVKSRPGHGSTFWFSLPLHDEHTEPA